MASKKHSKVLKVSRKQKQAAGMSMIYHMFVATFAGIMLAVFSHMVNTIDLLSSAMVASQVIFLR
ncbi:MAG: hypothetical protein COV29_03910 [Candidatus Yanofskybacteria bacterium CG10_big_fil_rev_8_21_14_0_10_36_16]|uniref:Uncharacterized protein n=1 Tax=Candidatus Yanofskybacteria bacterium CG10_big_fil_rev_8_21_14_0_10_36_16 TaxID=1975096 RepID=A0A2J0Q6P2_9BACT|nr:MAG: hypothetical protein COV29_03910 [Candidatus Yanofskybacteria bacterium CG10_big_fil_rev_8_21_14_0_10_36_16]